MSKDVPTYTETWPLLSPSDRVRLAELDDIQSQILRHLAEAAPGEDVDAPTFAELQVERLRVYRAAHERHQRRKDPS